MSEDHKNLFKDEESVLSIEELGHRFIIEKVKLEQLNQKQKEQSALVSILEDQMYQTMLLAGMNKVGFGEVTLSPQKQYWASIKSEDISGFEWLKRHELSGLVKLTVNSQSLSSVVREMIDQGVITSDTNCASGETVYFDNQGQLDGVNISYKTKILARGVKALVKGKEDE